MGEFSLDIKSGEFTDSEIMVMLGENGKPSDKLRQSRFWFSSVLSVGFRTGSCPGELELQ